MKEKRKRKEVKDAGREREVNILKMQICNCCIFLTFFFEITEAVRFVLIVIISVRKAI